MANDKKEDVDIEKVYGHLCKMPKQDFLKKFNVKDEGLNNHEVEERLHKYGHNEVTQSKPKKWYHYLFSSLFTPFNSILIGIAILLSYTDVYLAETPSYANIIVILVLVTVSTLLDFVSEYRSNLAAEALKELVWTVARNEKLDRPKNVLLVGEVGTGKSTMVECVANKMNKSLAKVSGLCTSNGMNPKVLYDAFLRLHCSNKDGSLKGIVLIEDMRNCFIYGGFSDISSLITS